MIFQNYKKPLSLILVIFFSLTLIIAGLDKFFNILDNWVNFLNPKLLPFPIAPSLFMKLAGIFEVLLGLSLFARKYPERELGDGVPTHIRGAMVRMTE